MRRNGGVRAILGPCACDRTLLVFRAGLGRRRHRPVARENLAAALALSPFAVCLAGGHGPLARRRFAWLPRLSAIAAGRSALVAGLVRMPPAMRRIAARVGVVHVVSFMRGANPIGTRHRALSSVGDNIAVRWPITKGLALRTAPRRSSGAHLEFAFGLDYFAPVDKSRGTIAATLFAAALGNRLTVDPRTLTPLVLVRIQVPQPRDFYQQDQMLTKAISRVR